MDIVQYNREAWTNEVQIGNPWTVPVDSATVDKARRGDWRVLLTPTIPVPRFWFGESAGAGGLAGKNILCLACGGGQQGPVFAAAGARVMVFDNCPAQLAKDRLVAERDGLEIMTVQGDMRDLSAFADAGFDLIFHPVSNCFVDGIENVWREAYRVLVPGGRLLAGFCNPLTYIFDLAAWDREKVYHVRYKIPYSDIDQLPSEELAERIAAKEPMEFGHSLDSQIGGQIAAGFAINGFFEDSSGGDLLDTHIKTFIATSAVKPYH